MIKAHTSEQRHIFLDKLRESALSVLPIIAVVSLLCVSVVPVGTDLMLAFLLGSVLVIVGIALFTMGSESSLTVIGSKMGSVLTKTRKLALIVILSFILGIFVTVAEPDLQVLAKTVPHINTLVLIITVAVGVGLFLAVSMLRMIFGFSLRNILLICYGLIFVLSVFVPKDQLAMAFDSGGVTTGPMTVPFVLAFGVGISNIRADKKAESDSFGLVALCSIGPILSVLILSFFYPAGDTSVYTESLSWMNTTQIGASYVKALPGYMLEMFLSLSPILVVFIVFQFAAFKLNFAGFMRIFVGLVMTFVGLVLFLTGVNLGFSTLGGVLAETIAGSDFEYLLIPLAMILGWFIISAEPAVYTLEQQIEQVSAGAITGKSVKLSLSVAISLAMGIAMTRVLTGIPLIWFVLPCYALALLLSLFVPDIYTAIAFDSGGVASGPMTATFMLQFMIGACRAAGGDVLSDAFGVVALVAMMPLLSVQAMGLIARLRAGRAVSEDPFGSEEIIELMEDIG